MLTGGDVVITGRCRMTNVILLASCWAIVSCDLIAAPCTSEEAAGISLTVIDSVTKGPVLSDSILVVTTDGSYADTARFSNRSPDPVTVVGLAFGRKGTYAL